MSKQNCYMEVWSGVFGGPCPRMNSDSADQREQDWDWHHLVMFAAPAAASLLPKTLLPPYVSTFIRRKKCCPVSQPGNSH